jgi:hypothetical protein
MIFYRSALLKVTARDAPRYGPGFLAVVVTSVVAAILAIVYRYVCVWENRKRDKAGTMENYDNGKSFSCSLSQHH